MKKRPLLTKIAIVVIIIGIIFSTIILVFTHDLYALNAIILGLLAIYSLKNRAKTIASINVGTNAISRKQYLSIQKRFYNTFIVVVLLMALGIAIYAVVQ